MIKVHLVVGLIILLGVHSQKDGDDGRPYEFSFTIDGEQHRYEKKDVNGIIQGEFGFITGDGVYHVTVYATDENGSFKILSMKNTKISEPLDRGGKPSTAGLAGQRILGSNPAKEIPVNPVPSTPPVAASITVSTSPSVRSTATTSHTPYDFTTASTIRNGCSSCGIVTKAPAGPLNFQNPAFKKSAAKGSSTLPALLPNKIAPSRIEVLDEMVSKSLLPTGKSVTYSNTFSGSSVNLPINPINSVQPIFNTNQLVSPSPPFDNKSLRELVPKPGLAVTQPSIDSPTLPRTTVGSLNGLVNIKASNILSSPRLLTPGTNPNDTGNRISQNPLYPSAINPPESTNNFPKETPSALSKVTVTDGIIHVPGNNDIQIKDKYPNMVSGLPEGITERDISDLLYKFNYTVGFHGHYEKGLKNGAKIGGYFVNGRDGISRVVTYVADENGYRPKFKLINLGLDSEDTPKPDNEKKFGLKNFEFIWYPIV